MANKAKKMNLRDCLDDNTLDLSMSDLEEVPVKEIALIKKGTNLDLSINKIKTLPNDFATLVHLTKLDLSKNQLVTLPLNFGELVHLKHLDLYCNKLENLPTSFGLMKSLRWLDLKDNPLKPAIATVAGQCLDQQQCQTCAKKIVLLMQNIQKQIEEVKLERAIENEQEQKNQEAAQTKKKKKTSKLKEKKKDSTKVAQWASGDKIKSDPKPIKADMTAVKQNAKPSSGGSCLGKLCKLTFLFAVLICLSLATLWYVDRERFTALQETLSKLWVKLVASLPPQVVETGGRVVNATRPTIELVCGQLSVMGKQVALKVHDGYSWLHDNELFQRFLVHMKSSWDVLCDCLVVGVRTVSERIPIYVEAIKKMIGM